MDFQFFKHWRLIVSAIMVLVLLTGCVVVADPTWDYVILDAGIDKGIVIGSRLAVMRGSQKVCELTVTLVENSKSSCDVVYSTMRPGDKVRQGDTVVSARD